MVIVMVIDTIVWPIDWRSCCMQKPNLRSNKCQVHTMHDPELRERERERDQIQEKACTLYFFVFVLY